MLMHTNTGKAAWLLCAVFIACGDDGTERLSTCPDARIVTDRMGIIRCAGPKSEDDEPNNAGKTGSSSGDARSSASPNRASQADAKPNDSAANGGSEPRSGSNSAGKPAAESGEKSPAPPGGAGAPAGDSNPASSAPSGGSWYCLQVMNACSCVMGSIASDTCDKPKPTCCVRVENGASVKTCVCYPEGSTECTGVKSAPATYPPVSECPPK